MMENAYRWIPSRDEVQYTLYMFDTGSVAPQMISGETVIDLGAYDTTTKERSSSEQVMIRSKSRRVSTWLTPSDLQIHLKKIYMSSNKLF
jgi:hypothetical protein